MTATATKYSAQSTRALATITRKGAPVVFLADTYRGGSIASDVTAQAVEMPGDPDTYMTLGVVVQNPVTLLVAAKPLNDAGVNPVNPGVQFSWAGVTYTVKLPTPTGPDGTPIVWRLVGIV